MKVILQNKMAKKSYFQCYCVYQTKNKQTHTHIATTRGFHEMLNPVFIFQLLDTKIENHFF